MSLAATLAADGMRPASFLPAVKCSQCGQEIEIASMGEHLCMNAPDDHSTSHSTGNPTGHSPGYSVSSSYSAVSGHSPGYSASHASPPVPMPPTPASPQSQHASLQNPFTMRQMNANGQKPATSPLQYSETAPPGMRTPVVAAPQMVAPRPMRGVPPRIDPFLAPRAPRSESPMSPAVSVRSTRQEKRSIFDLRSPSPEMSGNLDCAFPPFPTPAAPSRPASRATTANGRRTPGSDRAESRSASGRNGNPDGFEPSSVRSRGENGLQRPFTTGPLDGDRRRPSEPPTPSESYFNRSRRPSMQSLAAKEDLPPLPSEPMPTNAAHIARPTTPGNNTSAPGNNFSRPGPPARPDRSTEETLSPTFLDKFNAGPASNVPAHFQEPTPTPENRSMTFPLGSNGSEDADNSLTKVSSLPEMRARPERPAMGPASESESSRVPQLRPRSSSRSEYRADTRTEDAPPVPKPVQQTKEASSHSPSESRSSMASIVHSDGNSIGDPSPVGSAASSVDAFSPFSYNPGQYEEDKKMAVLGLSVKNGQKPGMSAEQLLERSPPRNFARPAPPRQLELVPGSDETLKPTMPATVTPMESPADPMLLTGKVYQPPPGGPRLRPMPTRTATTPDFGSPQPAPMNALPSLPQGPGRSASQASQRPAMRTRSKSNASQTPLESQILQPPPVPQNIPGGLLPARRPTTGKSICRGCGLIIEGKSIKAADGRLTGRWHKACFTCKTCDQPFTTADFYVIANLPYCEQHYHEKNDSCCNGCHRGIEGQYLETSSGAGGDRKYHPRCFTCMDCRQVLAEDYFKIGGRVYCERHALAAMRGQARMAGSAGGLSLPTARGGLTAERRTTKLMMM